MQRGRVTYSMVINWLAFAAWIGVGLLGNLVLLDEELGITHVWGLNPITWDTILALKKHQPWLFIAVALIGPVFFLWWLVHIYRRMFGDLSKK